MPGVTGGTTSGVKKNGSDDAMLRNHADGYLNVEVATYAKFIDEHNQE